MGDYPGIDSDGDYPGIASDEDYPAKNASLMSEEKIVRYTHYLVKSGKLHFAAQSLRILFTSDHGKLYVIQIC